LPASLGVSSALSAGTSECIIIMLLLKVGLNISRNKLKKFVLLLDVKSVEALFIGNFYDVQAFSVEARLA
jgi:hypothetical protein